MKYSQLRVATMWNAPKAGYKQLARQSQTRFVAALREKITLHENYLHTPCSSYYFLLNIFFLEKILWYGNFTASGTKQFEMRNTRNVPGEVTTVTHIVNLYTRFVSHMFSCCEHPSVVCSQPKYHLFFFLEARNYVQILNICNHSPDTLYVNFFPNFLNSCLVLLYILFVSSPLQM